MPKSSVRDMGSLVWREMDQKALDDAYDQDVYAPNRPLIVARRIAASE
jgi:arylformamidase